MKQITELYKFDLPDVQYKPNGYDMESIPAPTAENMSIYMDKINELVKYVNILLEANGKPSDTQEDK